jgi:hypothetical protein
VGVGTAYERGLWPGLVLEWRRTSSGDWQARVVYVPDPRRNRAVEEWFAPNLLKPIDTEPPTRASKSAAMYGQAMGG